MRVFTRWANRESGWTSSVPPGFRVATLHHNSQDDHPASLFFDDVEDAVRVVSKVYSSHLQIALLEEKGILNQELSRFFHGIREELSSPVSTWSYQFAAWMRSLVACGLNSSRKALAIPTFLNRLLNCFPTHGVLWLGLMFGEALVEDLLLPGV